MQYSINYGVARMQSMPKETQEKFYLKNGELNAYSLACGYVQKAELRAKPDDHHTALELWHEGACFHVRAHDHENKGRLFWDSFDKLGEARRHFHKQLNAMKKGF